MWMIISKSKVWRRPFDYNILRVFVKLWHKHICLQCWSLFHFYMIIVSAQTALHMSFQCRSSVSVTLHPSLPFSWRVTAYMGFSPFLVIMKRIQHCRCIAYTFYTVKNIELPTNVLLLSKRVCKSISFACFVLSQWSPGLTFNPLFMSLCEIIMWESIAPCGMCCREPCSILYNDHRDWLLWVELFSPTSWLQSQFSSFLVQKIAIYDEIIFICFLLLSL